MTSREQQIAQAEEMTTDQLQRFVACTPHVGGGRKAEWLSWSAAAEIELTRRRLAAQDGGSAN